MKSLHTLARRLAALVLPLAMAACATAPGPSATPAAAPAAATTQVGDVAAAPAAGAASAPAASASDAVASAAAAAAAASDAAAESPDKVAGVPTDPLQPDTVLSFGDKAAHQDLWQRIRDGFGIPDLDNDLVRANEAWYASRPDYVQRMTERGSRYLFHIVEEVQRRGMPTEIALLPFIESAYNPQAQSVARASGMWQFIPSTGKLFALKQNVFRDDRRDVLESTRAALDYLGRLHDMFGDWHLALAAYNWGEGNVKRAIAQNERRGMPTDYSSLRMPPETRDYVPKLQAVKNIVMAPERFNLTLAPIENHPYFVAVPIERDIDVSVAARLSELPVDEFQALNPSMNRPVILAAATERILLPYDNADAFVRNLGQYKGRLATWTAWVVPKTMRPAQAAKEVGMSEASLREVNRIPPRMLVRAGSTLLVPRSEKKLEDVSVRVADNATMGLQPESSGGRRLVFKARKGETVASVARRYRLKPSQVAQWNGVATSSRFTTGETVTVYVPSRAKVARASAHSDSGTHTARKSTHKASSHSSRTASSHSARGGGGKRLVKVDDAAAARSQEVARAKP